MRWLDKHHWFKRNESEQTLEESDGQGILACCSPCGHKESHDWAHMHSQVIIIILKLNTSYKCLGDFLSHIAKKATYKKDSYTYVPFC